MRTDHRPTRALATATALSLVAAATVGCSQQADGSPVPATTNTRAETPTATTPPSQDPTYGAPRVTDPIDVTRYLQQPCSVLDQQQMAALNVTKPGEPTTSGAIVDYSGPYCTWKTHPVRGDSFVIGFNTSNEGGLSDNYRTQDEFEYFEPTTVGDYPAVFTERGDRRDTGACNIVVGVSDTMTFSATEQGRLDAQAACDRAKQVAAAAVQTMRAGT